MVLYDTGHNHSCAKPCDPVCRLYGTDKAITSDNPVQMTSNDRPL